MVLNSQLKKTTTSSDLCLCELARLVCFFPKILIFSNKFSTTVGALVLKANRFTVYLLLLFFLSFSVVFLELMVRLFQ